MAKQKQLKPLSPSDRIRGKVNYSRFQLAKYLPKAVERIIRCIESPNDRVAFEAAKWLAEMVLGKPKDMPDTSQEPQKVAAELAVILRNVLERVSITAPKLPPVVDGTYVITGELPSGDTERTDSGAQSN